MNRKYIVCGEYGPLVLKNGVLWNGTLRQPVAVFSERKEAKKAIKSTQQYAMTHGYTNTVFWHRHTIYPIVVPNR